jgi:hypothetical protein
MDCLQRMLGAGNAVATPTVNPSASVLAFMPLSF